MSSKTPRIISLAAALAALTGTTAVVSDPADAKTTEPSAADPTDGTKAIGLTPNRIVSVGEDLLGFIVSKAADGTVVADHTSHYSHSSHSSHHSHYSSSG